MADDGTVNLHGKTYRTVALRVQLFRQTHTIEDGWAITALIIEDTPERVLIRASIISPAGVEVATGLAEEIRGSNNINRRAALENCETSAIGRALAAAGFGGSEYASADELATKMGAPQAPPTVNNQPTAEPTAKPKHHPSFEGNHAKWFFARLGEAGIAYSDIADELEKRGHGRPSSWPKGGRMQLLDEIAAGGWAHLQKPAPQH